MLCQNCGKHDATVRYTQIINGIKSEIQLCENCANKLGVGSLQFNMPMNFADFLSDFFNDYETSLLPSFVKQETKCENCGASYQEFVQTGLLGCPDCYETYSERLDPILKRLQGSCKHVGRGTKVQRSKKTTNTQNQQNDNLEIKEEKLTEKDVKLNKLNEDLRKAVKEERYEDAATIRDEIQELEGKKNKK